jgi:nucleoside phosphorylase
MHNHSESFSCPLALAAATYVELQPVEALLQGPVKETVEKARLTYGTIGQIPVCLVQTGVGAKRVQRSLPSVLEHLQPERIMLIGVCGAVSPSLETGVTIFPDLVTDASAEFSLSINKAHWSWMDSVLETDLVHQGGTFASTDRVFRSKGKRELAQRVPGVVAVDMEAVAFGKVSKASGVPWAVLKTVADSLECELPPEPLLPWLTKTGYPPNELFEEEETRTLFKANREFIEEATVQNCHLVQAVLEQL